MPITSIICWHPLNVHYAYRYCFAPTLSPNEKCLASSTPLTTSAPQSLIDTTSDLPSYSSIRYTPTLSPPSKCVDAGLHYSARCCSIISLMYCDYPIVILSNSPSRSIWGRTSRTKENSVIRTSCIIIEKMPFETKRIVIIWKRKRFYIIL